MGNDNLYSFGSGGSQQSGSKMLGKASAEKIDMFCHILPRRFKEVVFKKAKPCYYLEIDASRPALWDLDMRFRVMDRLEGLRQVLTLAVPPLELAFSATESVDMAKMANDEMAELVRKYPDRFVAAVACLPLNDVDASICEAERAVEDLSFKGIQIFTSINGKPLDRPEFMGLYEKMVEYDLPIWIHPARDRDIPDYPDEEMSKYELFISFAWPYESSLAMGRLVFGGILDQLPNIKFITHHCGAMLPFFYHRLPEAEWAAVKLSKPPVEYFKKFYTDTVLGGNTPALMCGYAFFGADQLLFGTDYPYPGGEDGEAAVGEVIKSVERMKATEEQKAKIFSKNARRILKLSNGGPL